MATAYNHGESWLRNRRAAVIGYNTLFSTPFEHNGFTIDYSNRSDIGFLKLQTPLQVVPTAFWKQSGKNAEAFSSVFKQLQAGNTATLFNNAPRTKDQNILAPLPGKVIREGITFYNSEIRLARGWVLVLDTSGSMHGSGIDGLRRGASALVDKESALKYGMYNSKDWFIALAFSSRTSNLTDKLENK